MRSFDSFDLYCIFFHTIFQTINFIYFGGEIRMYLIFCLIMPMIIFILNNLWFRKSEGERK